MSVDLEVRVYSLEESVANLHAWIKAFVVGNPDFAKDHPAPQIGVAPGVTLTADPPPVKK